MYLLSFQYIYYNKKRQIIKGFWMYLLNMRKTSGFAIYLKMITIAFCGIITLLKSRKFYFNIIKKLEKWDYKCQKK